MIFVSTIGFSGMPDLVVWSEITLDIALWVKSKMAAIWSRSNIKLISFSTEKKQVHDFGVYYTVFRYARPGSVIRNYFGRCIVGKIQDGRLFPNIIFDTIEVDSCLRCLSWGFQVCPI